MSTSQNSPFAGFGYTEQTLTLFPDRKFATEFLPEEVQTYIDTFMGRANTYLVGGRITDYEFHKETTKDGLVIVRVTQNVK